MAVTTRTLGRSGIEVSALGMGCWAIGGPWAEGAQPLGWGAVDDEESVRAVRRALELGVTLFDTADTYGAGHGERVLGRALAGRRDEAVIATKWGYTFDERGATGDRGGRVAGVPAAGRDRLAAPVGHRPDRPLPAAPGRPAGAPGRGAGRHLRGPGRRGPDPGVRMEHRPPRPGHRVRAGRPRRDRRAAHPVGAAGRPRHARRLRQVRPGQHQPGAARDGAAHRQVHGRVDAAPRRRTGAGPGLAGVVPGRPAGARSGCAGSARSGPRSPPTGAPSPRARWAGSGRAAGGPIPIPGCRTVAQVEENAAALARGPLPPDQFVEVERQLAALRTAALRDADRPHWPRPTHPTPTPDPAPPVVGSTRRPAVPPSRSRHAGRPGGRLRGVFLADLRRPGGRASGRGGRSARRKVPAPEVIARSSTA